METLTSTRPEGRPGAERTLMTVTTTLVGLLAGFFYAYESSVVRGLALVDDATYVATMASINATVRNPVFAVSFFGSIAMSVLTAAYLAAGPDRRRALLAVAGTLLVAASIAITASRSIPMNNELAAGVAADVSVTSLREVYEEPWNAANRLRTITSTAALVAWITAVGAPALVAATTRGGSPHVTRP